MKIVVIDYDYPSSTNLYGNVFVHVRVKEYVKSNECLVLTMNAPADYYYEGVFVTALANEADANPLIFEFNPDVIFVHFALKGIIDKILPNLKQPVFIWVHGFEVLGWYRRLFNFSLRQILSRSYAYLIRDNIRQIWAFRKLIHKSNQLGNPNFIFVSRWMKKICEIDCAATVSHYAIIPNPINTRLFGFSRKPIEFRNKVLLIRSFASKKYATDIAIQAIRKFSKKPEFSRFEFTIVGKGRLFERQTKSIGEFGNVKLINRFLTHDEIKTMHDTHGVYLSPTRQDAQGVSMCEAMSSGLVVITSNNTAIPEFVQDGETGFLTSSINEIVEKFIELDKFPDRFLAISEKASKAIANLCSMQSVISREMDFVEKKARTSVQVST